jgi:hypothetical protein
MGMVGYESGAAQPVAGLHVPGRRWHTQIALIDWDTSKQDILLTT